jgi:hypothetical protein
VKKILLIFAYWLPLTAAAQQHYWQQEADNTIDVSLNDIEHTLDGFIKINYTNNSPDTLRFIWFHLWPNAFKTDRTAFSEQLLQNGRTDFYFSDKEQKGYIDRLDFRVNGTEAKMEDHPLFIDIAKVILPKLLLPGQQIEITTPFHVKLPFNFSGSGHVGQSYEITQWYPQPAVYDASGWHEMPYLDRGGHYSEFGNFDVRITVPKNYVVAATGELQNEEEKQWLKNLRAEFSARDPEPGVPNRKSELVSHHKFFSNHSTPTTTIGQLKSDKETKTLRYIQNNIDDFVWFTDKNFMISQDTLQLPSGKIINLYLFYEPEKKYSPEYSVQCMKEAVRYRSLWIGEYPYNTISIVETKKGIRPAGYPTITGMATTTSSKELQTAIESSIGRNWFYGVLANNEREHPWMNRGMNAFYDKTYDLKKSERIVPSFLVKDTWIKKRLPDDVPLLVLQTITAIKKDQPIETSSEDLSNFNDKLIASQKASVWMQLLEKNLGAYVFDSCMRRYYQSWQYKHPYPNDFKKTVEDVSGKNMDSMFSLLDKKGPLEKENNNRKPKLAFLFNAKETNKYNYISLAPVAGYNMYDKFMIGAVIHNYNLPPDKFQFIVAPLYATNSRRLNGIGDINYSWYPDNRFQKISIGLNGARFSTLAGIDSNGNNIFGGFYKIVPSLRFTFKNKDARSTTKKWIDFRTYVTGERGFDYFLKTTDSNYYPAKQNYSIRYLNQLSLNIEDNRVLYPYNLQFQVQQASEWYRLNFTGNYFFNYAAGGGMSMRFFAARFGYLGGKNSLKEFATYSYQPKLTASIGSDDYTYSNYFIGRNEFNGFASQQIMMRDGGLKLRTDIFQNLQGRSDNWVAALNFNTSLPASIIPKQIPLKIFFDIGSYADAWGNDPPTSKFLYAGGLQLSLLKNIINIYVPIIYSSDFRNQLKTVANENSFFRKISFSIDIQNINLRRINRNISF